MARLLVKARDYTHSDPDVDKMVYKVGDIVNVQPDGHVWGGMEGLPDFYQIDIPSITPEQIQYLSSTEQELPQDTASVALKKIRRLFMKVAKLGDRKDVRRRRYAFDVATITFTNGQATLSDFSKLLDKRGT